MNNLKRFLIYVLAASTLVACSGGGSGSSGNSGNDDGTKYEFNGKSPSQFFSQFYIEVLACDKPDKSKWLRKGAVVDASINSILDMENGFYVSIDVLLTADKYKLLIEILEKSKEVSGAKTAVATGEFKGLAILRNGKVELGQGEESLGTLSNGFEVNGEDTMILVLNDSIKSRLESDVFQMIQPIVGKKMLVKNIRELLSTAEGNIGCTQGAETLVF